MNKKQAAFLMVTLIVIALLIGLGLGQLAGNDTPNDGKLQVVATFYPLEYFAKEIGGEKVNVNSMVPFNVEVHSWQPSVSDILTADKADIILYNGAGLDIWFEDDILPSLSKEGKTIMETTKDVRLMENDHEEDENDHEHDDLLYDPHTWISPFIAKQQAENIYKAFVEFDSDNMDFYKDRWDILKSKFEELDIDYQTQLADKKKNVTDQDLIALFRKGTPSDQPVKLKLLQVVAGNEAVMPAGIVDSIECLVSTLFDLIQGILDAPLNPFSIIVLVLSSVFKILGCVFSLII